VWKATGSIDVEDGREFKVYVACMHEASCFAAHVPVNGMCRRQKCRSYRMACSTDYSQNKHELIGSQLLLEMWWCASIGSQLLLEMWWCESIGSDLLLEMWWCESIGSELLSAKDVVVCKYWLTAAVS
jgi:hypothetical protein